MKNALSETAAVFSKTAAAVRPDQFGAPTPCREFTVGDLLDHVGGTLIDAERAARKTPRAPVDTPGGTPVSFDGASAAEAADRAVAAWLEPSAMSGLTDFGPGEMPAAFAAGITLHELALHGWDLASATGQDFVLSEETAQAVLAVVEQIADQARSNGGYGPELLAAEDAGAFERALAASGREADRLPVREPR